MSDRPMAARMDQAWLFHGDPPGEGARQVRFHPDFESWQSQARRLFQMGVPPQRLWWQPDPAAAPQRPGAAASGEMRVPRAFIDKARAVACHRGEDRWALLYQLLWRLAGAERHLLELHGDPQVVKFDAYARSVARDVHKMKAFVRFRAVAEGDAEAAPRYVAWFEPEHHIVEYASGFFRRRFAGMRWSILTPERCAHWEGAGEVWFSAGVGPDAGPTHDAFEDAWRLYYRSIFNPARLKVSAMLSEMPQKYWKNLPEARLIPSLVLSANQRTAGMQAVAKALDEPRCGPRPPAPGLVASQRLALAGRNTAEHLALQAAGCRRCPLWEPATQTVWGEGPVDARIMLVGEQPGDQEDLAGRPFVGPAGQLLDRALAEAGLDRRLLYLTNTVKHFKFKSRGKRRLHDKPLDVEVLACLPWLQEEIAMIRPALVICLGATAARAQLGRAVRINQERGRLLDGSPPLLLTFHPSYLLRLPDPAAAADAFRMLVADLRLGARAAAQAPRDGVSAAAGDRR